MINATKKKVQFEGMIDNRQLNSVAISIVLVNTVERLCHSMKCSSDDDLWLVHVIPSHTQGLHILPLPSIAFGPAGCALNALQKRSLATDDAGMQGSKPVRTLVSTRRLHYTIATVCSIHVACPDFLEYYDTVADLNPVLLTYSVKHVASCLWLIMIYVHIHTMIYIYTCIYLYILVYMIYIYICFYMYVWYRDFSFVVHDFSQAVLLAWVALWGVHHVGRVRRAPTAKKAGNASLDLDGFGRY